MMNEMLHSFNDFKILNGSEQEPLLLHEPQMNIKWLSFNTFGENMKLGKAYGGNFKEYRKKLKAEALTTAGDAWDEDIAQGGTGLYHDKFCLGVGGEKSSVGQDSIIVGEVYTNAWGGVDTICRDG